KRPAAGGGRRRRRAGAGNRRRGPGVAGIRAARAGEDAASRRRHGRGAEGDGGIVKVGAAPISWGASEFPEWGRQLPYGRVFDEMAAAGYDGTELGPPGYLPLDAGLLREELARRHLAMIAAFVPVNMRTRSAAAEALGGVRRTAELLAALGATEIMVA